MIGNVGTNKSNVSLTGSMSTASINGNVKTNAILGKTKVGNVIVTRTDSAFKIMTDTTEKWNSYPEFIPKEGTLVVYTDKYSYEKNGTIFYSPGIKIADGNSYLIDLPFITAYDDAVGVIYSAGTQEEWMNRIDYIPKKNEIIVVTDKYVYSEDGITKYIPGIKIGDGNAYAVDLPFITDSIERKLNAHIADQNAHISATDRQFWNRKLNFMIDEDNLVFNRL